jgi:hypothetical protein
MVLSVNHLTQVRQNVARTLCYRIGSHIVSLAQSKADYHCICNGLTLWAGILLDHDLRLEPSAQEHRGFAGRVKTLPWLSGEQEVNLTPLLTFLDNLDSALLREISGYVPFKGVSLIDECEVPANAGVLVGLCRRTIQCLARGGVSDVLAVKLLHQTFCFLKKIQIDRPDLNEQANAEFIRFERGLEISAGFPVNQDTLDVIQEMNTLARKHLSDYSPKPLRPKHGPGVVASKSVNCWYDKYQGMSTDARIEYLLGRNDLGTTKDYSPWVLPSKSTRTSRYVSVPKSWKKLRGISAEPAELMFFQQAVLASIDNVFKASKWWRDRIDLHDQAKSRKLALRGSLHDSYATIDLSAASDSVTLELVKRVFKGTPVLPWLLGTRSVHTICSDTKVRLRKFAPMGSACCFPVECIVFALAAQVASDRTYQKDFDVSQTIRVFGDDIIVDWFAADETIRILNMLGFSVNTDKTYTCGLFREACGVEAYRGVEIQPLRYKRLGYSILGPEVSSIEDTSKALEYCNTLYYMGYHVTREFLLQQLLQKQYSLGKKSLRTVKRYLPVTFSGGRGTLASPCPTNFNRLFKFDRDLQTLVVRSIGFRLRLVAPIDDSEMSESFSCMKYHEWLLGHQPGCFDGDARWKNGWIDLGQFSELDRRMPLGFTMVPTEKWVVWTHTDSLV